MYSRVPKEPTQFNILIAESFSCQRDLILNLKQSAIASQLTIYAAHSAHRAEILTVADVALDATPKGNDAVAWTLEQCKQHQICLVFIGKNGILYENARQQFEAENIILITGALSPESHQILDDKFQFSQICQSNQLPITPAYFFHDVAELQLSYAQASQDYPTAQLCAKPIKGVFGHGFIRFKENADFHGLFRIPLEITLDNFVAQYAALDKKPAYILMPFLSGHECSVDIACHRGEILSLSTRIKEAYRQKLFLKGECDAICHQLVKLFDLDGLINIQFKQDAQGLWHILEINARPAGGFSYSMHTGRNLMADLIAHKLQLPRPITPFIDQIYVYPYTASLSEQ